MEQYANNSGRSNVIAYLIGPDYIVVRFANPGISFYKYTYDSAGQSAIEAMKQMAQKGSGLNTFISSKSTQPTFASKGVSLESVL